MENNKITKSESIFRKRWKKFKRLKRGYYSFLLLLSLYALSFFFPLLMNSVALVVKYEDQLHYPMFSTLWSKFYLRDDFDLRGTSEVDYRILKRMFEKREFARTQGKLIQQYGIYPNKPNTTLRPLAPKWEPIEDWIIGYRIDIEEAVNSPYFTRYSEAEAILNDAVDPNNPDPKILEEYREAVDREQQAGVVYLKYWNDSINPVDVNPNWQQDRKMEHHKDGVGFRLKCHLMENTENIAVIDEISWKGMETFEALHIQNYLDLTPSIIKAEQSLPQEDNWVVLPPYEADYRENFFFGNEYPSDRHWLGTDEAGRDIFVRMCYGFNISITFAVIVLLISYTIGITVGAVLGYFGGVIDLLGLRLVEIWSSVPFLYVVIILGALFLPAPRDDLPQLMQPAFWKLTMILSAFGWMAISFYIRGEFLREKAKDYVAAAISIGTPDEVIIFKHILPNALTPVISFAPFVLVGYIVSLVSLDFLGFGLPSPMPSWGELIQQGVKAENGKHMIFSPIAFMFATLICVVFIGEAIREAFDPKVFSRLR